MSEINEVDRKTAEELVRDLWAANKDTHYERILIAVTALAQARREGRREADPALAGLIEALTALMEHCEKQGWWLASHAVEVMNKGRAALEAARKEPT